MRTQPQSTFDSFDSQSSSKHKKSQKSFLGNEICVKVIHEFSQVPLEFVKLMLIITNYERGNERLQDALEAIIYTLGAEKKERIAKNE